MKAAIYATGVLICSIAVAHAALVRAQSLRAPRPRPPEISADWHAPRPHPPVAASAPTPAPRGNLRGDIESNARWNENGAHPRPPPKR
ncbi:hypothetical protein DWV00_19410 [Trinickia dinghuensis]|uniref:Uncharacterized protein n=1 Tax=Trinickia dinghuensis TaxID=2291023 RepID=A0A3D8JXL6_9BURK|nr:hypothetical protein DWV00_19410 [Trinickia dinghuensis]